MKTKTLRILALLLAMATMVAALEACAQKPYVGRDGEYRGGGDSDDNGR